MKDTLILQDKKYISARRAAELFVYTPDYVGQLCREGKLECTMVGRSWFVNEESVLKHKLSNLELSMDSLQTPLGPIRKTNTSKFGLSLAIILLLISGVFLTKNYFSFTSRTPRTFVASILNGLVVAPSSNSSSEDEQVKQNFNDSFSDEVAIKPDSSGTAGIITPVFRESQGNDFLYVMVPVKDTKK